MGQPGRRTLPGTKSEEQIIAEVSSLRGTTRLKTRVTTDVNPGVLHTTFHFPQLAINHLIGCVGDQDTMTPEFKVIAVDARTA